MTTKKRGRPEQNNDVDNQRQKNMKTLIDRLRQQLKEGRIKYILDEAIHLNEEWNAMCGYEHSNGGRLTLTVLSGDVTCPKCLDMIKKTKLQSPIKEKSELDSKRQNPIVERIKQVMGEKT